MNLFSAELIYKHTSVSVHYKDHCSMLIHNYIYIKISVGYMARLLLVCVSMNVNDTTQTRVHTLRVCVYNDEGYILYTYTRSRNNLIEYKSKYNRSGEIISRYECLE